MKTNQATPDDLYPFVFVLKILFPHLLHQFLHSTQVIRKKMKLHPNMALLTLSCVIFLFVLPYAVASDGHETFIVHMSKSHKPLVFSTHNHWYTSIIQSLPSHHHPARILYTYDRAARGFSARLSAAQASAIRRVPGVVSVVPDAVRHLHTTRTPSFLGLDESFGLWPDSGYGDDAIIGVLDTGIWPERASFSDEGFSPVPSHWKGSCVEASSFASTLCNRKLIGARAYYLGYEASRGESVEKSNGGRSPRDTDGHGTHTASTAAGSRVVNASLLGFAKGEARGMAVKARIAVYKICWTLGCYDTDILAAMERAIEDGVDVISLSVGGSSYPPPYFMDSIAIGAFGAAEHGIVVSCSAGNAGPDPYSAVNIAPWILTVGASSIDRDFPAEVILGDGTSYRGVSLYAGEPLGDKLLPLVYAADCGSRLCYSGRLNPSLVAGKIVLCDRGGNARVEKGNAVHLAGGAGMILANLADSGEELLADAHFVPATMVGEAAGNKIRAYVRSDPSPTATITFEGTVISKSPPAPRVAAFSSRGPNYQTTEILKPDVIAPGLNILAAWTDYVGPTTLDSDNRRVQFNIISGTSMSCPHVSGLAALLRGAHPEWSPAVIKSALMTTAYNLDNSGNNITDLANGGDSNPYAHGSGHVEPNKAVDPGLVYDLEVADYISFLCSIGYDKMQIAALSKEGASVDCDAVGLRNPGDLNYPSFSVVLFGVKSVVKYRRTVRNVGKEVNAVYEVKVNAPPQVEVTVSPTKLVFSEEKDKLSYQVTFRSSGVDVGLGSSQSAFGSIEWSDGDGGHRVRSPVVVAWLLRATAEMRGIGI